MRRQITFEAHLLGSVRKNNTILVFPSRLLTTGLEIELPAEPVTLRLAARRAERRSFISAWSRTVKQLAHELNEENVIISIKDGITQPLIELTASFEIKKSTILLPLRGDLVPLAGWRRR